MYVCVKFSVCECVYVCVCVCVGGFVYVCVYAWYVCSLIRIRAVYVLYCCLACNMLPN